MACDLCPASTTACARRAADHLGRDEQGRARRPARRARPGCRRSRGRGDVGAGLQFAVDAARRLEDEAAAAAPVTSGHATPSEVTEARGAADATTACRIASPRSAALSRRCCAAVVSLQSGEREPGVGDDLARQRPPTPGRRRSGPLPTSTRRTRRCGCRRVRWHAPAARPPVTGVHRDGQADAPRKRITRSRRSAATTRC